MTLSERIAREREARGYTQRDLAREMGVSPGAVALWETDRGAPTIDKRADLSRILGIPFEDMLPEFADLIGQAPLTARGPIETLALTLLRKLSPSVQRAMLMALAGMAEADTVRRTQPAQSKLQARKAARTSR